MNYLSEQHTYIVNFVNSVRVCVPKFGTDLMSSIILLDNGDSILYRPSSVTSP